MDRMMTDGALDLDERLSGGAEEPTRKPPVEAQAVPRPVATAADRAGTLLDNTTAWVSDAASSAAASVRQVGYKVAGSTGSTWSLPVLLVALGAVALWLFTRQPGSGRRLAQFFTPGRKPGRFGRAAASRKAGWS